MKGGPETGNNTQESMRRLGLDEALRTLSQPIQRRILLALYERGPDVRIALTEGDAESWSGGPHSDTLALHHQHLPRLDNDGLIEWDRETGTVSRGEDFADIAPMITMIEEHQAEFPWNWP